MDCPFPYQLLAVRCWESEPSIRWARRVSPGGGATTTVRRERTPQGSRQPPPGRCNHAAAPPHKTARRHVTPFAPRPSFEDVATELERLQAWLTPDGDIADDPADAAGADGGVASGGAAALDGFKPFRLALRGIGSIAEQPEEEAFESLLSCEGGAGGPPPRPFPRSTLPSEFGGWEGSTVADREVLPLMSSLAAPGKPDSGDSGGSSGGSSGSSRRGSSGGGGCSGGAARAPRLGALAAAALEARAAAANSGSGLRPRTPARAGDGAADAGGGGDSSSGDSYDPSMSEFEAGPDDSSSDDEPVLAAPPPLGGPGGGGAAAGLL
jgi:hypothetical protein